MSQYPHICQCKCGKTLNQVKQSLLEEIKEKVEGMKKEIEPKLAQGEESDGGYYLALKDILDFLLEEVKEGE